MENPYLRGEPAALAGGPQHRDEHFQKAVKAIVLEFGVVDEHVREIAYDVEDVDGNTGRHVGTVSDAAGQRLDSICKHKDNSAGIFPIIFLANKTLIQINLINNE